MIEKAWQLHILKARWLSKDYPGDMIITYLHQNMHKLAVSLHDRTTSVLYDGEDSDVVDFENSDMIEYIINMNASGMKNQGQVVNNKHRSLFSARMRSKNIFGFRAEQRDRRRRCPREGRSAPYGILTGARRRRALVVLVQWQTGSEKGGAVHFFPFLASELDWNRRGNIVRRSGGGCGMRVRRKWKAGW